MRGTWTIDQAKQTIEQVLRMGTIDRIDFGEFVPVGQTETRSGFLHMAFVDLAWANWLKQEIETTGHARLQIAADEFWMLIPNRNPLPSTHLNIHQLAEITRNQAQRIAVLEATIEDFGARAAVQEARMNGLMARLNAFAPAPQLTTPAAAQVAMSVDVDEEANDPPPLSDTVLAAIAADSTPMDIQQNIILPPVVNPSGPAFLNLDCLRMNSTNAGIFIDGRPVRNHWSQDDVDEHRFEAIMTPDGRAALDRMQMSAQFCGNH